ncbi:hypothetical protein [Pasteuria penetrans]|nr:hypothetical protein [Pasteuria penetrans]
MGAVYFFISDFDLVDGFRIRIWGKMGVRLQSFAFGVVVGDHRIRHTL